MLLTNLQSIQNNLEKSEFETRARLGSQIEGLERELALAKERLHSEEDRRIKTREAYEMQVCVCVGGGVGICAVLTSTTPPPR